MISTSDLTQILVALTGLIAAVATLVQAFRNVHAKIEANTERIDAIDTRLNGGTPKIPPGPTT